MWLYVLRTCVCIAVFDFRAYDLHPKTKLYFRGRLNNNACILSCSTLSTLYCLVRCQIIMQPSCGDIEHRRFSPSFFCLSTLWLDLRHKTKLYFRGSEINYAFKQSCTTFCQLYIASAPCTLMVTMVLLACVYAC